MQNDNTIIESVKLLISRLERLSADSRWSHRASGLRGSLWRCVEELEVQKPCEGLRETGARSVDARLERLMAQGYTILEQAAREINAPEK
jgi:hypothetical protein